MDNTKNDTYYINKIIKDLTFIKEHTENLSQESLENNEVLLDSMLFRLIQISESTKRLTEDSLYLFPRFSISCRNMKGRVPSKNTPHTSAWAPYKCFGPV